MSVHEARSRLHDVLATLTQSVKRELFNAYQPIQGTTAMGPIATNAVGDFVPLPALRGDGSDFGHCLFAPIGLELGFVT
jgi:hypothetical protein